MAVPFVLMGLVMVTVGGVVGYRTPSQVRTLQAAVEASPGPALQAELQRMEKVNRAWPKYVVTWSVMGIAGLLLRLATRGDFTQGLGISLVFFSGLALLVDGFAERRTHPCTRALQEQARVADPT
ncbi:MAG: hypothetical protein FJ086_10695 [Deltaproteobacteria bacterium]|nr:hypothetical protein [Deltaproteobacteria bacterium]